MEGRRVLLPPSNAIDVKQIFLSSHDPIAHYTFCNSPVRCDALHWFVIFVSPGLLVLAFT